jgi:hypothetical protein
MWELLAKTYEKIIVIECILLGDVLTCNVRFQFITALNLTFYCNINYGNEKKNVQVYCEVQAVPIG